MVFFRDVGIADTSEGGAATKYSDSDAGSPPFFALHDQDTRGGKA